MKVENASSTGRSLDSSLLRSCIVGIEVCHERDNLLAFLFFITTRSIQLKWTYVVKSTVS